jgi:hypothetical protein
MLSGSIKTLCSSGPHGTEVTMLNDINRLKPVAAEVRTRDLKDVLRGRSMAMSSP